MTAGYRRPGKNSNFVIQMCMNSPWSQTGAGVRARGDHTHIHINMEHGNVRWRTWELHSIQTGVNVNTVISEKIDFFFFTAASFIYLITLPEHYWADFVLKSLPGFINSITVELVLRQSKNTITQTTLPVAPRYDHVIASCFIVPVPSEIKNKIELVILQSALNRGF